jgi:hypothetical protein
MNFQDLYKKIASLDQPVAEAAIEECGEPMMPGAMSTPHQPPSMSINVNAQGMDDISELMKLLAKINPESGPTPLAGNEPQIEIEPMDKPVGLPGVPSNAPPMGDILKSLSDIDSKEEPENDGKDIDGVDIGGHEEPDMDNMGGPSDHDADNQDEPEDESQGFDPEQPEGGGAGAGDINSDDEQEEAWANATPGADGPEIKDVDYMVKQISGGMNREKGQYKHSYKAGDNPMAMPESDLRAMIKAELNSRLQAIKEGRDEGKPGKNFAKIAKSAGKHYGSKEAGERVAGAVRAKLAKAGKL